MLFNKKKYKKIMFGIVALILLLITLGAAFVVGKEKNLIVPGFIFIMRGQVLEKTIIRKNCCQLPQIFFKKT